MSGQFCCGVAVVEYGDVAVLGGADRVTRPPCMETIMEVRGAEAPTGSAVGTARALAAFSGSGVRASWTFIELLMAGR